MYLTFDEQAFLTDCPATPLSHLENDGKYLMSEGPYQVTIYITRECNLNCTHCYISAGSPLNDELNKDEWKLVINKLNDIGTNVLYILGGEPLLKHGIFDIISYSTSLGLYTSLSSNGTVITKGVSKKLKESNINEIQISIDGPNEEINSLIRGKNSFKLAIEGVKNLINENIPTSLSYVITEKNKDYIEDMIKIAEELNVKSINFSPVQQFGRAKINNVLLKRESAIQVYNKLRLLNKKYKIKITTNGFRFFIDNLFDVYLSLKNKINNYYSCPAGRSRFIIDANGDIYGCELLINPLFKEGNALKDDLREIWKKGFTRFRNKWYMEKEECKSCSINSLCQGGCFARAFNSKKDINCPF
ncbi:radical SAM additional 4Fe4S-binding domain protein [Caldisphaera lagunensis DSM 15908]|uniref:Radical SAM additional 4Fe4S-binding domain protein n=1 Tax=Caldisphaera lagunensis (strain DSM 15908 / JCM 11604 / ANMR 0165 / IC-154) TaxID=1056495 RepID=L0AC46_CALLD|nr:radical SAM protein [Caldisphaera lagunensis]AFZ70702.1 radical SAM additional 4Fe4S-binding domain protein [Caldisphaera lagunensis DSM 15908]